MNYPTQVSSDSDYRTASGTPQLPNLMNQPISYDAGPWTGMHSYSEATNMLIETYLAVAGRTIRVKLTGELPSVVTQSKNVS
jgi:hypothetical protein